MSTETPALSLPLRSARPATRARAAAPASPTAGSPPRFTLDGSAELEVHLARSCEKIAAGLRGLLGGQIEAVLLGGGYGRGEGGVWRTPEGDRPYNDLEFYVCLRGNRHLNELRHRHALHVLGEILTPQVGIEVELKITSLRELARNPVSIYSHDLISGHRWVVGREELLRACGRHRDATQIPLAEATRLLMNRATGLLLAEERLQREAFGPGDADFVRRNIAKVQLALGDAVLVGHGQYHTSARERHRRLQRLTLADDSPWLAEICRHHAAGVEFKLHPFRSTETRAELRPVYFAVNTLTLRTWLWLESRRLGVAFQGAQNYAENPVPKWPDSSRARNLLINAKALGLRGTCTLRALRHPRERVLHSLALLLWEPAALTSPALRARIGEELQTDASTFPALVAAYRAIWAQVN